MSDSIHNHQSDLPPSGIDGNRPRMQFSLLRLLGGVTCLALSAGLMRHTSFEVLRYGWGCTQRFACWRQLCSF